MFATAIALMIASHANISILLTICVLNSFDVMRRSDWYYSVREIVLSIGRSTNPLPAPALPRSFDEIEPGHLVLAQESLEYGWWEAIVLERAADMFTLRYRDYPKLPKFVRHRSAVALMSPPAE